MSIHNNMLTVLLPIACFLSNISFSSIVPFSSICNTYILYFLLIFFIHGLLYFLFLTFISLFLYFSSFPHYCFSFFTVSFSFTVFLFSSGHSSMPLSQHSKQHEWQAIATQWPPQTPPHLNPPLLKDAVTIPRDWPTSQHKPTHSTAIRFRHNDIASILTFALY